MKHTEFWKNFRLGEELSVSGAFIYNGLRRFHELKKLDHTDDLFEVLYNLSVGFERMLKIAIVLLEHRDSNDQAAFEKSLITHNHPELLSRIKKHARLNLSTQHNDFLALLARFYKTIRYGRFSLDSVARFHRERQELCAFLAKHLNVTFPDDPAPFGIFNEDAYRKFITGIAIKISSVLYEIDIGDIGDYLDCFQSDAAKSFVMDQLEHLYEEMPNKSARLERMGMIGAPNVDFSDDDSEEEPDEDLEPDPDR